MEPGRKSILLNEVEIIIDKKTGKASDEEIKKKGDKMKKDIERKSNDNEK